MTFPAASMARSNSAIFAPPRRGLGRAARGASIALILLATPATAVEQADEFLRGLHDRGLHELALDYLRGLETSQLVDDEFREQIPYYRGLTLIEQSRRAVGTDARARLLDAARAELDRFASDNPASVPGAEAMLQLANILVEQGKQSVARGELLPSGEAYETERDNHRREARQHFSEARGMFSQSAEVYEAELARVSQSPPEPAGVGTGNERQEYRGRLAQIRVLSAQSQFYLAQTHAPDSSQFRQSHEAAARELAGLFEQNSRWLIGFHARLYEGRCYQALGQYSLALGCFEEILSQPNVLPEFRRLIASAYRYRTECLAAEQKYDAAIEGAAALLGSAHPDEVKQPEWLAVRFRMAEAQRLKGEALAAGSADKRRWLAEARDAFRFVSAAGGEFQVAARAAVATLGASSDAPQADLRTFQAAYDLGKEAMTSSNAAQLALPAAERNNPAGVAELRDQAEQGKTDARRYFRLASTLVDDDTDLAQLNEVRYFLCWLDWDSQDYYRAAVLGEFLARRYPDHPAASSAAKISLASYERLYQAATATSARSSAGGSPVDDGQFEARRMAELADFITRRWPGTPDADAAFSVLVSYAIRSDNIAEAERLLASAAVQNQPRLELQLGSAMWSRYLELSQQAKSTETEPEKLQRLKSDAVRLLRSGLEGARQEQPLSDSAATGSLYLAQALLADGQYDEAISLLENRQTGPLVLVSRGHRAASRPEYAIEVYKAALRAYVSVSPPQGEKALETMDALEQAVESLSAGADDQVAQIYIGLGLNLQHHVERLREAGRGGEAARVSEAFAQFLERISARQDGVNWATRSWIAHTYFTMGAGRQAGSANGPASLPAVARQYLQQARDVYQELLDAAAADAAVVPSPAALLAAKVQLAECYRELGEYQRALDMFSAVLAEKEASLAVQRAAALAYQQRGRAEDPQWLERAIFGGYQLKSTGKNRIWGWIRLGQVAERAARSNPAFRDAFFEARLNAARCRYLVGIERGPTAGAQDLATARQSIRSMIQLYPDLGGHRWRPEFDALLKEIQTALSQPPIGLKEFSASP